MRLIVLSLLLSLSFTVQSQHQHNGIDLFDGKSLDGWDYYLVDPDVSMEDVWSVEDGLLVCKGEPMGYLATKDDYTSFKLIVEWRWAPGEEPGNSGVLMRIGGEPKALPRCVEAQLQSGNAGAIYGFHGFPVNGDEERFVTNEKELTGKLTGVNKIKGNENEPGEWNRYEITMLDDRLTLLINGEKVNEAHGLEISGGKIGFQSEGGEVHFRKMHLTPLSSSHDHQHQNVHIHHTSDWPQFHGPNRNNRSSETGLLESWPEKGPEILWTSNGLGHGFSSVSLANGQIFTAGNIDDNTVISAMNMEGEVVWQTVNGKAWTDSYPGTRGTPTIDGDFVYHQNPLGNIVCLKADSGEIVWEINVMDSVNSRTNKWALAESLLIDGDNLISCPGGPEASIVAMNKNTGEFVWKARSIGEIAGYSSPILVEIDGLRIIINLMAKSIVGVNADNGNLLWHVMHESYADENVLMPIYQDGYIFTSTLKAGSVKWKISVDGPRASLLEQWRTEEMDNHHGDVALIDGYLYGTSTFYNRNKWVCLDWETGELKYVTDGTGKSSLTYADGKMYTLSIKRLVGLTKPGPENFEIISTFEIPDKGDGLSWAHPVVSDGRLYIRHGDYLFTYLIR